MGKESYYNLQASLTQLSVSMCSTMFSVEQVAAVGRDLLDPGLDLARRFRALFTLKNMGGKVTLLSPTC